MNRHPTLLHEIPARWAAERPAALALVDATTGERVTWSQLHRRVRAVAGGMLAAGLRPGDRVAVLSRNTVEFQVLYFAAAAAGLVLQPLNWRLAPARQRTLLADAPPAAVVVSDALLADGREVRRHVEVGRWWESGPGGDGSYERMVDAAPRDTAPLAVGVDDPVFMVSTGGTSGVLKAAVHTHRSAWAGMVNQSVAERIVASDVYLQTGQMFHVPVVLAMNYLRHGCPVVLSDFAPRRALELIESERVSSLLGIATMLNWMMAEPGFAGFDLGSLRNIQYGGGPMPETVIRRALDSFPCSLIQGYGQTEGTTMTFLDQEDHVDAANGIRPERLRSCGREAHLSTVRVVHPDGVAVPRDSTTVGQVVVSSPANMVGYFRQPELTAKTLRNGCLWTGDLATWDEHGYVYLVDRVDDMIISGGENVYSTQVEAAIARHPAVLECAVVGVPDDTWGEAVTAHVVIRPGMHATAEDIVETARVELASYQKPRSVHFVDALPRAVTGKVLKRELRRSPR